MDLRNLILKQLTDKQILSLLDGCTITQAGKIGVISNGMLKTDAGLEDLRPHQITSVKSNDITELIEKLKGDIKSLKVTNKQLRKDINDLLEEPKAAIPNGLKNLNKED